MTEKKQVFPFGCGVGGGFCSVSDDARRGMRASVEWLDA